MQMVLQRRGWQTHVSAGTKITGTHSERFMFIPVRPRPPWSPTREGSYRLWNFPASALTLEVVPGYRPTEDCRPNPKAVLPRSQRNVPPAD
ncbi:hypothetical protein AVEN_252385-1 [Araneus ventricosus]|uniref:Uncharacterized protein n=1 Tax=Araneus ventricosus TaxID=182803 RepID=A0A4Y2AQR6_ARAVE|nr:hypothetical protein AVEN_252385-1 [Araneus ventricosus]